MTCLELRDLAPLYWSSELDADRRLALERHLEACADCAGEMKLQRENDQLLRRAVLQSSLDPSLIVRNVQRELAAAELPVPQPSFRRRAWLAVPTLAVVLLIAVVLFVRRQPAPQLYADAVDDHYQEVVQHAVLRWASGMATIAPVLQAHGIDPAIIGPITPPGYQLEKIRICELASRNYAHLVFTNGSHEVSIFVRRAGDGQLPGPVGRSVANTPVHQGSSGHYEVAAFHAARYDIVVTSDESLLQTLDYACKAAESLASLPVSSSIAN